MYSINYYLTVIGLFILITLQTSGQSIDIKKARAYFNEAKELSQKDGGKLWGIDLFGPLVFVDNETREGVANVPVPVDDWEEENGVYKGYLPDKIGFANTAFEWEGESWSMVIFNSLSDDKYERGSLMMHELWHQHEDKLDLLSIYELSGHLDKKMGRVLLFLEWNALLEASKLFDKKRTNAIQDALAFRKSRSELYPEGFTDETAKELHEGLAEYTGMTLCAWDEKNKVKFLEGKVSSTEDNNTIAWTHAYTSGALYGFLLDEQSPGWNKKLVKGSDLGEIASKEYKANYLAISEKQLPVVGAPYGYDSIMRTEEARAATAKALHESYKKRFDIEPILLLPNFGLSIQFNPSKITPYENVGNVYGELTGQSDWGEIKVMYGGILLLQGWKGLVLDVGENWNPEMSLISDRYEIVLADGYEIVKTEKGWTIEKE